ncbi:uncharacterized protein LOC121369818 [Gigantopelta aegis]|uniref:uncharacterized protein LOC121369818 n=1 Tax=Gigantopelta aegis TaxID=1735272 RepID=UPI001B88968F|nr:uncharacterized protein LOC121369818 [Gigantopelta aegis]
MTFGVLAALCITLLTDSSCGMVYPNRSLFNYICMLSENSYSSTKKPVSISISSEYEVDVSMSTPFLSATPFEEFTLNAGQGRKIAITPEIRMPVNSSVSERSILIQATKSVSVILVNDMESNFDVVHLMELDALGTDYVVLSFVTTEPNAFIGIAVPFNETTISIRLPARVKPIDVFVNGRIFSTYPELTLTLQAYDALQILSGDDLTGTVISSDKKIAVFSGNTRTKVFGLCLDYMMEEMPRVSDLGNEYIVFSPYPGPDRDLLKLVALANNTAITVDGGTTLNIEREFNFKNRRFSRLSVHHIRATHPLLVGGITFSAGPLYFIIYSGIACVEVLAVVLSSSES